jgi:hypothetical protein
MYLIVAQSFDKAILGLSTASLGFTFAFLKVIAHEKIIYSWLLKMAWGGFILAIVFVILSLIITEQHALHRSKYFSNKMLCSKIKIKLTRCRDKLMSKFQYLSAICFTVALASFTFFVGFNFNIN